MWFVALGYATFVVDTSAVENWRLLKDDAAVAVERPPVFGVPLHGLGERGAFHRTAALDEGLSGQGMIDALDALFNDRALIQVGGDVVGGGPNEFDPAVMCLVIRPGALAPG